MDKETEELIKKDELKPRKHSGVVHRPLVQLPEWVTKAMLVELEGNTIDIENSLSNY